MQSIEFTCRYRTSSGTHTSDESLKKILSIAGYTDEQIKTMHEEDRIIVIPTNLNTKLKGQSKLYVIEKSSDFVSDENKKFNRFGNLDTD